MLKKIILIDCFIRYLLEHVNAARRWGMFCGTALTVLVMQFNNLFEKFHNEKLQKILNLRPLATTTIGLQRAVIVIVF